MAQLKTQALELISIWEQIHGDPEQKQSYQVEQLLSQIEDSLELTRYLPEDKFPLGSVNLAQVVEDFAETFARRFGPRAAGTISLAVDPRLPIAKTHPFLIMRIIDCLARAVGRVGVKHPSTIAFTLGQASSPWPFGNGQGLSSLAAPFLSGKDSRFKFVISCSNLAFAVSPERIQETLIKFRDGNYVFCVFDLGLDLCAAFHLVRQMDGIIRCEPLENNVCRLDIELNLERAPEQPVAMTVPQKFYFKAHSPVALGTMKNFSAYHGCEAIAVSNPQDVPLGGRLVYDATILAPGDTAKLRELPRPEDTILIVDSAYQGKFGDLNAAGFRHYLSLPLVSSKLLRALSGVGAYSPALSSTHLSVGKKLHVLVVDDAETARIIVRDYFEGAGHEVTEASDGAGFSELIKRGMKFDLVFCDLNMYHVDGLTAVKTLREYERVHGGHIPVVMMTAYATDDMSQKSEEAGYDRLLLKPVDCASLEQAVRELVPGTQMVSSMNKNETEVIVLDDLRRRCAGKTKTMVRVLDSFVATSRAFVPKLQSPDFKDDHTALAKTLHTLKGLLRDVAAQDGAHALEQLEEKMKANKSLDEQDFAAIERWINTACDSAESVKRELEG